MMLILIQVQLWFTAARFFYRIKLEALDKILCQKYYDELGSYNNVAVNVVFEKTFWNKMDNQMFVLFHI